MMMCDDEGNHYIRQPHGQELCADGWMMIK